MSDAAAASASTQGLNLSGGGITGSSIPWTVYVLAAIVVLFWLKTRKARR